MKGKATDAVITRKDGGIFVRGRRYTLGEISRGSGISRPHVTRIFNGKRGLTLKTSERISGFLGLPIDTFLSFMRN